MAQTFGRFKVYPDPGIIIDTNKGKIANPRTLQNEAFTQCGARAGEFRKIASQLGHPMEIQIDDYKYYFPELELYRSEYKCCKCNEDYFNTARSGGKHLKHCSGSGKARLVKGDFEVQLQWVTTVASVSQRRKYFAINRDRKVYEGASPASTEGVSAHTPIHPQDNHVTEVFVPQARASYDTDDLFSESELFMDWPYNIESPFLMTTPQYAEQFGFRTFITDRSYIFEHIGQNYPGSISGVPTEYALMHHIVARILELDKHIFQRIGETELEILTGTPSWSGRYFDEQTFQKCIPIIAQLLYVLCSLSHYNWVEWRRESIVSLDTIKNWINKYVLKTSDWSLDDGSTYSVITLDCDSVPNVIFDSVRDLILGLVQQAAHNLYHPLLAASSLFVYDFQYNAFKTNEVVLESLKCLIYGLQCFVTIFAMRSPTPSRQEVFNHYAANTSTLFRYLTSLLREIQSEDIKKAA